MPALPPTVAKALGSLSASLAGLGYRPEQLTESKSFGDFEVIFAGRGRKFSVVRDRGQFHIGNVEQALLEPAGLWRSYSGVDSLAKPLLVWLGRQEQT